MDVSPITTIQYFLCIYLWMLGVFLFVKRKKISSIATAITIRKLMQELLLVERYMKSLPVGPEREAAHERYVAIKKLINNVEGIPNSSNAPVTPQANSNNKVVSLISFRKQA